MNTEFVEMIKQTPFYQMGDAEGEQRGEKRGEQKGRVNTTVEIIRNGIASLETLIQTLNLTPEEIAAIEALLQQSSNGNGNGQHI
jgi:predicted transposase YdaD